MKIVHLIDKTIQRVRTDGVRSTLKEIVYFNRIMVGIDKIIEPVPSLLRGTMKTVVVDRENYKDYQERFNIRSLSYYCPRACECLILHDANKCFG